MGDGHNATRGCVLDRKRSQMGSVVIFAKADDVLLFPVGSPPPYIQPVHGLYARDVPSASGPADLQIRSRVLIGRKGNGKKDKKSHDAGRSYGGCPAAQTGNACRSMRVVWGFQTPKLGDQRPTRSSQSSESRC